MHRIRLGLLLACLGLAATAMAAQQTYRIGNSLTWDSQPKSIEALAAQRGLKHIEAYHINCGQSLERIWTHPKEICVPAVKPFGTFGKALPNYHWDAVTFQPYPRKDSTLATDTARILDLIKKTRENKDNSDTVFYIYAAWPGQKPGPYHEVWMKESADSDDTKTILSRAYFENLYKRVKAKTDADVRMIPAGQVIYELDKRMRAGKIAGYKNATNLYRDAVHLNNVGRYAAGVTTFATLYGKNPAGLKCPPGCYGGGKDFSPELYKAIHDAIWDVLTEMRAATGVRGPDDAKR